MCSLNALFRLLCWQARQASSARKQDRVGIKEVSEYSRWMNGRYVVKGCLLEYVFTYITVQQRETEEGSSSNSRRLGLVLDLALRGTEPPKAGTR